MAASQLTITVEQDVMDRARRAAEARGTNVSEFLVRALGILATGEGAFRRDDLPPLTRRALGLAKGIPDDDSDSIAGAIEDKHGPLK